MADPADSGVLPTGGAVEAAPAVVPEGEPARASGARWQPDEEGPPEGFPDRGPQATTVDAIFGGTLRLTQPARGCGYRFNVDALLLAREALGWGAGGRVVDLGAGCGVAGLALRHRGGCREVVLVERDPWIASLAAQNAAALSGASVLSSSVESMPPLPGVDLVVSNPPYTPPDDGRPCPEPRRADARRGEPGPFLAAAARVLSAGGRALFVYPAQGLPALLSEAARCGLTPVHLRLVHSSPGTAARVVLVGLVPAATTPLVVAAPWFERDGHGAYDPGLAAFLDAR